MTKANITKRLEDLSPEDVGSIVSFDIEEGVTTAQGAQVGLAGRGGGTLLGYFVMAEGEYVSLAIEGYQHHIAGGFDDQIVIHEDL